MGELDGHWAPSFRDCSMDVDMVTDFLRESAKIGIPTFIQCAVIPQ